MVFKFIHAVKYCFIYIWKSGPQQIEGTAIKHERMALNFFMASARTRKANITFLSFFYIHKGANLRGAGCAFAPPDFLVSKSKTYYKFLPSKSRSLEQSCSAPPLFSPDWRPCTCIYVCIQIEYVKLSKFLHSYTYSLQLYLKF